MKKLICLTLVIMLSGCVSTGGRYSQKQDSAPTFKPAQMATENVEPEFVQYNAANNRPYTVLGKRYYPIETGKGYEATGEASWYGQKFHGHLTANGEIYDMYGMSAAHKTLPLPSFVKVTNIANKKEIIVRVNDRGPFHDNRIIDLSYAAAYKLDMLGSGTTNVKIEVIHVSEDGIVQVGRHSPPPVLVAAADDENTDGEAGDKSLFIQVAALQDSEKVSELARGLATLYQVPTQTPKRDGIYRLQLGPISSEAHSNQLLRELISNGFIGAYKLYTTSK